jgi:hypothetical protein
MKLVTTIILILGATLLGEVVENQPDCTCEVDSAIIGNGAITWPKLSPDVQDSIRSEAIITNSGGIYRIFDESASIPNGDSVVYTDTIDVDGSGWYDVMTAIDFDYTATQFGLIVNQTWISGIDTVAIADTTGRRSDYIGGANLTIYDDSLLVYRLTLINTTGASLSYSALDIVMRYQFVANETINFGGLE